MYNTRFLPQLEKFRRDLFGDMPHSPSIPYEGISSFAQTRGRGHGRDATMRYAPPPGVKFYRCKEDTNGEWVPDLTTDLRGQD